MKFNNNNNTEPTKTDQGVYHTYKPEEKNVQLVHSLAPALTLTLTLTLILTKPLTI